MGRKTAIRLLVIVIALAAIAGGTLAAFTDTETSTGNTFTAGTLDLKVGGQDDPLPVAFSADKIYPGWVKDLGSVTVKNAGSIPGLVTLMVNNVVSNENGELEPELSFSGTGVRYGRDLVDTQVDPTGYAGESGYGELWDQMNFTFYVDNDPQNGKMEWYEPVIWQGMALDMTAAYKIPINENLFPADHSFDETLDPGEEFAIGVIARFFNDTASPMTSQPQFNGLNNNMTMSDDVKFDVVFGLVQK